MKHCRILEASGFQEGLFYEKHRNKIKNNGLGYMSKHGTLLHYASGNKISVKVNDRNSYNWTNNWSYRDRQKIDRMNYCEYDNYLYCKKW